ncbi:MAG: dTDP-4-dehydrorhamnose 3,5-epimerase [Cyclobacteriaceae bacterium]|nr:dTDP-4-dehydrorhamnose 3,5-epimerase [Cyclobacteriaceae bacterium]MCK5369604.1 dTDP-4-dehydrorhamnose 3,5-epimerase [Cyclobacteriaceae bacterium]MCK5702152.1 dTDP-4-dehydrorhamnose 3,5-epimerase [Cyclobacteriaceae bacterium]
MRIRETGIDGLIEIIPTVLHDDRGWFLESYNKDAFASLNLKFDFVQDNLSFSKSGVLRGLHFQQKPFEQGKLIKVIKGEVLDVAVDIRPDSPTLGQHYKVILTSEKQNMFFIPEGFAHGFFAIKDSYLFYKCTKTYNKDYDTGIAFDDPELKINWENKSPIISEKDKYLQSFQSYKSLIGL